MDTVKLELLPPQRLAVAYARSDLRSAFTLLLAFDARLADIVGRASEPIIAQMKLAWWYDAIARDPVARPKGEPILQALGEVATPSLEEAMKQLLDAWGMLLAADDWTVDVLAQFADARSSAVFGTYATWVGCDADIAGAGEAWSLADLRQRFGERGGITADGVTSARAISRKLRPLSILALSVTRPSGVRMVWHALTGR
jgi:15-cis-phytoene synthase